MNNIIIGVDYAENTKDKSFEVTTSFKDGDYHIINISEVTL